MHEEMYVAVLILVLSDKSGIACTVTCYSSALWFRPLIVTFEEKRHHVSVTRGNRNLGSSQTFPTTLFSYFITLILYDTNS